MKTTLTHTPAPWSMYPPANGSVRINGRSNDGLLWTDFARVVVEMDGQPSPEGEANARLILAAPVLLSTLIVLLKMEEADAAIMLATQPQP